mgnify:CR=1 FL=1
MFHRATGKIVEQLTISGIIQSEKKELYRYGINQLLNNMFSLLTFFIIGILLKGVIYALIFLMAYFPLRVYAGGFHASTAFRCWILSSGLLVLVLLTVNYAPIPPILYDLFACLSIAVIIIMMPIEDANKPLDEKEIQVYKKRGVIVLILEILIFILFRYFQLDRVAESLAMAWISLSILLLLGNIKNKKNKEDVNE